MKEQVFRIINRNPRGSESKWREIFINTGKTLVLLLGAVVLTETLSRLQLDKQILIMVYILAALVISRVTPGYVYGIAATVLGAFSYDFWVIDPRAAFSLTASFPITLLIMLTVTLTASTMTTLVKKQACMANEGKHRAELLYEMNQKLLAARDLDTVSRLTIEYLVSHIQRPTVFYTDDPLVESSGVFGSPQGSGDCGLLQSPEQRKLAHSIYNSPASARFQRDPLAHYLPVLSGQRKIGLVGFSCAEGPLAEASLTFIQMLSGQVALALELQHLTDKQNRILVEAERESMRGTLLRAISHDLRTPLTSILGASSTILEQRGQLDEKTKTSLVLDIKENAQWLIRMVENLLTVTRISNDTRKVNKTLEAVEEVVAGAVSIVRKRFPDWTIHVKIPDALLMVPMDATLISQVLINLLENAAKNSHSGSLILLDVSRENGWARFDISDNGKGIPEQLLDHLFEATSLNRDQAVDSVLGMGIGLSICRTILQAHGGTIRGKNRTTGGARFTFLLPLEEENAIV